MLSCQAVSLFIYAIHSSLFHNSIVFLLRHITVRAQDEAVAIVKAVVNERRNTSESSRHMGLLRKVSVRELIRIYL